MVLFVLDSGAAVEAHVGDSGHEQSGSADGGMHTHSQL